MGKKNTFIMKTEWGKMISALPDEAAGQIIKAVYSYVETGETGVDDPVLSAILALITDTIDANAAKYEKTCEERKKAADKRWEADASESSSMQTDANACKSMQPATDNEYDTDSDKDNITPSISPPLRRQIPPTVEMVREYCNEKGFDFDPQAFVDHYESNGWMVGKTKMKDWQASCRTWAKSPYRQTRGSPKSKIVNFEQHDYDFDETERALTMIQVNGYG